MVFMFFLVPVLPTNEHVFNTEAVYLCMPLQLIIELISEIFVQHVVTQSKTLPSAATNVELKL